jgi:hypothetical protein
MATRCVTYPIRVHLCVSVVRRQSCRVDKRQRIHRGLVEEWYMDIPFTDLRMACAYRLIHPKLIY